MINERNLNRSVFFCFPNYFLLPTYSSSASYRIRPLGPEECLFELWSLTRYPPGSEPPVPPTPVPMAPDDPRWPTIPGQDYSNLPKQQLGLHAEGFDFMRLSPHVEGLIGNYQRLIDGYLAGLDPELLVQGSTTRLRGPSTWVWSTSASEGRSRRSVTLERNRVFCSQNQRGSVHVQREGASNRGVSARRAALWRRVRRSWSCTASTGSPSRRNSSSGSARTMRSSCPITRVGPPLRARPTSRRRVTSHSSSRNSSRASVPRCRSSGSRSAAGSPPRWRPRPPDCWPAWFSSLRSG